MQNNPTPQRSVLQCTIKKRWVQVFSVLILLCAVVVVALPYVVRHKLERWLVDNGAQSAEIKKVRLNLLAGSAGLDGLQVKLNNNVVLGDSLFNIDIQLLSLFKKELHIRTGKLTGLLVDIEQLTDGSLRIGSITFPSDSSETGEVVEEKDVSWFFRASHVELEDCQVRVSMPKLQEVIFVERAVLTNLFTGTTGEPASLELKGTVNDIPLYLGLDRVKLHPDILAEGRIKFDGYNLGDLQQILSEVLDPFAGSVTLDGKVHFALANQGEIVAGYDGEITAVKIDIGNDNFFTQGPSASYSGTIQYQQNADSGILIDVNGLLQGEEIGVGVPASTLELTEKHLQLDGKTKITLNNGVAVVSDAILNFNSFNLDLPPLNVKHSGLKWQGHSEYTLSKDPQEQTVHADGELTLLEPLYQSESQDFSMHSEAGQVSWQGQVDYLLRADKSNLLLDGILTGNELDLQMPELFQLSEDSLSIAGKTTLDIKPELQVVYDGDLNLGPTNVTASDIKASGKDLSWQGKMGYQFAPKTVSLNGKFLAEELDSLLEGKKIQINQHDFSATCDQVSLQIGEQIHYTGNGSLEAGKLQVARADSPLLSLDTTTVKAVAGTTDGGVQVENVTLKNLDVSATEAQPVTLSIPEIVMHSLASPDFKSAAAESLEIRQLIARDTKNNTLLASVESIIGSKISVDKQAKISLASLSSDEGLFLQKEGDEEKPQVTLGRLEANDISWAAVDGLFCDQVGFDSLFANYTRIKPAVEAAKQTEPEAAPETVQEKEEAKAASMPLQINKITVTGKSGFRYLDQATSTPFTTMLDLETFEIKNINSAKPEIPFTFLVKGMFDKYAPFDYSGSIAPFSETFFKDGKIILRNYSLAQLSPYVIDSIGTRFVSGQLDITSEVKVTGNELDLDNDLLFKQLKSETVQQDLQEKLNSRLPVSLDTALSMLEDNNGNIELNVPVTGPRSALHVNPTDILITAFSKAIMVSVTPYLAYTVLGPTGALAYLGLKIGQSLIKTGLPSLEFENGESEITDAHAELLESVGKRVVKEKDQNYTICSSALVWELAGDIERNLANQKKIIDDLAARKALYVLADKRARNVQEYLVQNFSIEQDRLLVCAPTLNFEVKGKAAVNFMK